MSALISKIYVYLKFPFSFYLTKFLVYNILFYILVSTFSLNKLHVNLKLISYPAHNYVLFVVQRFMPHLQLAVF